MNTSWISISRPRFWLYLAGPYLIGLGTAIDLLTAYGFFYFLIPANIFLYAINDYADRDTDKLNMKKHHQESWSKTHEDTIFRIKLIALSLILLLPLMYFSSTQGKLLLGIFLFLSYAYSVKPFRLKSKPFLDSMSNVLYIIPGIYSYTYVTGSFPDSIYILAAALWSWSMHLFSAIPDIQPDSKAHIQTTAVVLGKKNSLVVCALLWGAAGFIMREQVILVVFACIYAFIPIRLLLQSARDEDIVTAYWKFPFLNAIIGWLLFVFVHYL